MTKLKFILFSALEKMIFLGKFEERGLPETRWIDSTITSLNMPIGSLKNQKTSFFQNAFYCTWLPGVNIKRMDLINK